MTAAALLVAAGAFAAWRFWPDGAQPIDANGANGDAALPTPPQPPKPQPEPVAEPDADGSTAAPDRPAEANPDRTKPDGESRPAPPPLGEPVPLFKGSLASAGWTHADAGAAVAFVLRDDDEAEGDHGVVSGNSNSGEARCRRALPGRFQLSGRISLKPAWGKEGPRSAGIRIVVPGAATTVLWIEPQGTAYRAALGSDSGAWPPTPERIGDRTMELELPAGAQKSGTADFSILLQDGRLSILFGDDLTADDRRVPAGFSLPPGDGACSVELFVRDATATFEQFQLRQ